MEEKLIIRISNNFGNQLFMYAAAYAASKKLNKNFFIDNLSSYNSIKNIYTYSLDGLNLSAKNILKDDSFIGLNGNLKRKILKKIDIFRNKKIFLLEKYDHNKKTFFNENILRQKFANKIYMEGYFESEKYFIDYKDEIFKEFEHINNHKFINNPYYKLINDSESVSLCLRQNRHSEKFRNITSSDSIKSELFIKEQLKFINKAISFFKSKLKNPKFFLWSNNYVDLNKYFNNQNITFIENESLYNDDSKIHLDLFLMTNCKHFAVIPSSFNWWGCWLSKFSNKIVLRPNDKHFEHLEIKNKDYWPNDWLSI